MSIQSKGASKAPAGSAAGQIAGPNAVLQPGRRIAYKADGTAEGSLRFQCSSANIRDLPTVGSANPDDRSLSCHHIDVTFNELKKVSAELFYHGITFTRGESSRPIIDYQGGVDIVPIQLHPKFADMAGTPSAPKNGAFWKDPETDERSRDNTTAEFHGFTDPSKREFFGVEHFFVNRPLVSRTVWTKSRPNLTKGMTIVTKIPGFTNPPGIVNWLLMDTPYRQVGSAYQTTEQYKGSPEPGWSKKIYPQD